MGGLHLCGQHRVGAGAQPGQPGQPAHTSLRVECAHKAASTAALAQLWLWAWPCCLEVRPSHTQTSYLVGWGCPLRGSVGGGVGIPVGSFHPGQRPGSPANPCKLMAPPHTPQWKPSSVLGAEAWGSSGAVGPRTTRRVWAAASVPPPFGHEWPQQAAW